MLGRLILWFLGSIRILIDIECLQAPISNNGGIQA